MQRNGGTSVLARAGFARSRRRVAASIVDRDRDRRGIGRHVRSRKRGRVRAVYVARIVGTVVGFMAGRRRSAAAGAAVDSSAIATVGGRPFDANDGSGTWTANLTISLAGKVTGTVSMSQSSPGAAVLYKNTPLTGSVVCQLPATQIRVQFATSIASGAMLTFAGNLTSDGTLWTGLFTRQNVSGGAFASVRAHEPVQRRRQLRPEGGLPHEGRRAGIDRDARRRRAGVRDGRNNDKHPADDLRARALRLPDGPGTRQSDGHDRRRPASRRPAVSRSSSPSRTQRRP